MMTLTLLVLALSINSTQQTRIGDGFVMPPQVTQYTPPAYTDEALSRGIQGSVTVEAAFDADGNFTVLRIVKGLGFGLDESALNALKNWRFTPAYRNGGRVSAITQIDVAFTLPEDPHRRAMREITEKLRNLHRHAEEASRRAQQVHEALMQKMKESGR